MWICSFAVASPWAQHWFNRASHLHLPSHSFSTTLLIAMCWQCCLSEVIVTLSHAAAHAVAFPAISVSDSSVWNSSVPRTTPLWWRQTTNVKLSDDESSWEISQHWILTYSDTSCFSVSHPEAWRGVIMTSVAAIWRPRYTGWSRYRTYLFLSHWLTF